MDKKESKKIMEYMNKIGLLKPPDGCAIIILSNITKPVWIINKILPGDFLGGIEMIKHEVLIEEDRKSIVKNNTNN